MRGRKVDVDSVRQQLQSEIDAKASGAALQQVQSSLAEKASKAEVAQSVQALLSDDAPQPVAVSAAKGSANKAPRVDHTHPARVQRTIVALDAQGQATWTFGRPFDAMPSLGYMVFQTAGQPIVVDASAWVMGSGPTAGKYVGVSVRAYRSQNLPIINAVSGLLTAVITGVNSLVSALTGFNVFGGGSLIGVQVHLSAGDQM